MGTGHNLKAFSGRRTHVSHPEDPTIERHQTTYKDADPFHDDDPS